MKISFTRRQKPEVTLSDAMFRISASGSSFGPETVFP
jgi:hypothetical protein